MLRTGSRQLLRQAALPRVAAGSQRMAIGGVRHQSSNVPRRSVKNGLARWAIAIGGTYWYMTSPIFNEAPAYTIQEDAESGASVQTIASVKAASRFKPPHPDDIPIVPSTPTTSSPPSINPKSDDPGAVEAQRTVNPEAAVALEEEAASQGAFNEETGEINWDCPCLGGMAYGPCGEQFREAFSCFVFSEADPKGMDCIDRFERMQGCFREHPETYASEIADDEAVAKEVAGQGQGGGDGDAAGAEAALKAKAGPDVDQPSVWEPLVDRKDELVEKAKSGLSEAESKLREGVDAAATEAGKLKDKVAGEAKSISEKVSQKVTQ